MSSRVSQRVAIAGIPVDNLTQDEAIRAVHDLIAQGGPRYTVVVNAAKVVTAARDPELRRVLMEADLVTADGMSVVWAAKLLRRPLKARVTGIDLFERLMGEAAMRGLSVYLLGASGESVERVAARFQSLHPGLRIAGYRDGYFDRSKSTSIADSIKESRADVLFVAMGSPAQEKWIAENLDRTGVRFALGVGGSFDHFSGFARRAPRWMQRAGLEWLYRLSREPRRLWRRYLISNTVFLWLIAKQILRPER